MKNCCSCVTNFKLQLAQKYNLPERVKPEQYYVVCGWIENLQWFFQQITQLIRPWLKATKSSTWYGALFFILLYPWDCDSLWWDFWIVWWWIGQTSPLQDKESLGKLACQMRKTSIQCLSIQLHATHHEYKISLFGLALQMLGNVSVSRHAP